MYSVNHRTTEIVKIFKKLKELNLGILGFEEVVKFRKICNEFIKDGKPCKGNIPILGLNRIINYNFSEKKIECILKYTG